MALWLLAAWFGASLATAAIFHRVRVRARAVALPADVSPFLRAFEQEIRQRHPAVALVGMLPGRFTAVLAIEGQETPIQLHQLYRHWRAYPEAFARLVTEMLAEVQKDALDQPADHSFDDVALRLLPQIRSLAWLSANGSAFGDSALVSRPFGDELAICYVIDDPWSIVFVTRAHLQRWGRSEADLYNLARANLRRIAGKAPPVATGAEPVLVQTGDGYDASRVLLLGPEHAQGLLIGVPERDTLWTCVPGHEPIESLMRLNAEQSQNAAHPVSPHVFRYEDGELRKL